MLTPRWSDCASLRLVCCGGEAMTGALRAQFHADRDCRLYNMYGPTETTVDASFWDCGSQSDGGGDAGAPIGRPIANLCMHVLDRHLNLAPVGVTGELYIGGIGLARGYFGQPGFTAERFIPDPYDAAGGRLYRSGDLARRRADGAIEFQGRADHQVKLRGFRIELEEIEALLEGFPSVGAAAVSLRTDARGEQMLAAYVETQDQAVTPEALARHARSALPAYMIPTAWRIMAALPRDANGKLLRSALPAISPRAALRSGTPDAAPANEMEAMLAGLFAEVLGLPSVGRHDGFFELGGHSLLAVQLAQRIRDALKADISLVALFQFPTVAALAQWLRSERMAPASPFVTLREGGADHAALYLLPTGAGHIRNYHPLIAALGWASAIHGVQFRAVENPAIEPQDFQTLVRESVELLRQNHRGGAYRLLGWSLGGLIAMGVAAELEALGERVGFLGLIDALPPRNFDEGDWKGRLAEFLEDPGDQANLAALSECDVRELEQHLAEVPPAQRPACAALWGRERGLWFNQAPIEILRLEAAMWRHGAAIEDTFLCPRLDQGALAGLHLWWAQASLNADGSPPADWASKLGVKSLVTIIEADHNAIISSPDLHASVKDALSCVDP
jgi:thioesterase domain-containing protein/acyl carrier protein